MYGSTALQVLAYDLPNAQIEASSSIMKSEEKTRLMYFKASSAVSALGVLCPHVSRLMMMSGGSNVIALAMYHERRCTTCKHASNVEGHYKEDDVVECL